VAGAFLFAAATATPLTAAAAQLGITQVVINPVDHTAEEPTIMRGFVPTLSRGPCLATLADAPLPTPGTTLFCSLRVQNGVWGVLVSLFLPEVPASEAYWVISVYQDRARGYGDVIPFVPE
jgi:hypothetical protein